jgi:hypothetical protein
MIIVEVVFKNRGTFRISPPPIAIFKYKYKNKLFKLNLYVTEYFCYERKNKSRGDFIFFFMAPDFFKTNILPGTVVCICNPGYSEGGNKDHEFKANSEKLTRPYFKTRKQKQRVGM